MSRARHSSRDIEFDLPGALDDMAGLASKAAIGHGARDVEVFGNGRQGRPAERQSCDVQPPPAASKKDTVVIISTNNPGRLMLFAALNPKLGEVIDWKTPADYGGFGGDELRLFESDVILSYVADKYAPLLENDCRGPTVEARALSALLVRAVFYKAAMPGPERAARLKDLLKQLDLVESLLRPAGPYCVGDAISFADVVLYPTVAMMQDQAAASLVGSVTEGRPKLAAWLAHCNADPRFRGVADKIKAFVDTFLGKAVAGITAKGCG
ncbi:hypothetical protein EMIHUDRAFT_222692 [Emiliania huxleyi CCMP1516]|uniref:GST C-terminal domain-containing protein n=2 Tax=Emiliania huxleyi TaxID=2903 RepID=A0A0D3KXT9_EMIH1|nr:hypothetical protein EMIHUDRAFT_222692 [Emiliania huxleyi CCMP1516]EOD40574.1 hypothetical protein EMIHUDRAFT_222692 [Emiliania huxleyi CCMP1516]|eukprot:XP_005793003.1 hypothetical protein EMIHUDRAFT_222692 [Emiliania huxleyi CCMP1516]